MYAVLSYRVSIGACASSYRMSMGENPWLLGCLLITFSQICRAFSLFLSRAATGDAQLEVNKLRSNQNADFRLSAQYSFTTDREPPETGLGTRPSPPPRLQDEGTSLCAQTRQNEAWP